MENRIEELLAEQYIYSYFEGYKYLVIAIKIAVKKQILEQKIEDFLELIAIQSLESTVKISRCLRRAYTISTLFEKGYYYKNCLPNDILSAIYYKIFTIANILVAEGYC